VPISSYKRLSLNVKKNTGWDKNIAYRIPVNLYADDLQPVIEERRLITAMRVRLMALPISSLVYCRTPAAFDRKHVEKQIY
jgi:hypothetical protein